jgi:hypothetical protein
MMTSHATSVQSPPGFPVRIWAVTDRLALPTGTGCECGFKVGGELGRLPHSNTPNARASAFETNSTFHILRASQRNARHTTFEGLLENPNDRYSCRCSDHLRRVSRKRRPCPSPRPQCISPCGRHLAHRAECRPSIGPARVQQSSRRHDPANLGSLSVGRIPRLHGVAWTGGMRAMPTDRTWASQAACELTR